MWTERTPVLCFNLMQEDIINSISKYIVCAIYTSSINICKYVSYVGSDATATRYGLHGPGIEYRWPCSLRRRSEASRLLGPRFRIPLLTWMMVL
jgi:hypothetical protein